LVESAKKQGAIGRGSPLLGVPRHTHLDLCQFFSPAQQSDNGDDEGRDRSCLHGEPPGLWCCAGGGAGCSCGGVGEGCSLECRCASPRLMEGGDLAAERRDFFQRKPKSAPRLHWDSSPGGLCFESLERGSDGVLTGNSGTNPGPDVGVSWGVAGGGPGKLRSAGSGDAAPLIVKSKSFPFTLASRWGSELECN